jgi:hypothetical protein
MHARTRKHAHTGQYVILIAFAQQQLFREFASMLRYTYIACPFFCNLTAHQRGQFWHFYGVLSVCMPSLTLSVRNAIL